MKLHQREVRSFLYSQYFADGLRTTIGILLPALLMLYFGRLQQGIVLSLGAICVSMADSPGPVSHKRNGMLYSLLVVTLVAFITGFAKLNVFVMAALLAVAGFFFSMFNVYGQRAAAVGTAGMVVMILSMEHVLQPADVPLYAGMIAAGGLWYFCLSLVGTVIAPFRPAQRALGHCIRDMADYLRVKSDLYRPGEDINSAYTRLMASQVLITQKQDEVRELLFKSRQVTNDTSASGRALVMTFVEAVDLYEHITATYYDYPDLRSRFGNSELLEEVATLISTMANELDKIGLAIQTNQAYNSLPDFIPALETLKTKIDKYTDGQNESTLVLKKILVTLINLNKRLKDMLLYFQPEGNDNGQRRGIKDIEYHRFISHQSFDVSLFRNNLTFKSAVFRHSLRVAIACLVGFAVAKLIAQGHHSYWILLTIIIILKPAFSLTRERNYQRLLGTLAGGAIGMAILLLIHDKTILFALLVVFMTGAFSFTRINYIVMVILMTPYVLILFSLLGMSPLDIAEERILDTLAGGIIAFGASRLIFPNWESEQVKVFIVAMLKANAAYLQQLLLGLSGKALVIPDYKLARKEVYVSSANLSAAFQRMVSEPKSKQTNGLGLQQFVVLNHVFSSNLATVFDHITLSGGKAHSEETLRPLNQALAILTERIKLLDDSYETRELPLTAKPGDDDELLRDQVNFIHKVSTDIARVIDEQYGV
jgi:uncharacterized membrane protein (TIGR01666 family)